MESMFGVAILAGIVVLYCVLTLVNRVDWLTIVCGAGLALFGFVILLRLIVPVYAVLLIAGGIMWSYCGLVRRRQVKIQTS